MSRSTDCWSGVVGGEVACGTSEAVVERDRGRQCEELGGQTRWEGVRFSGAVVFEAEHVLGGLKDALDALADRGQCGPWPGSSLRWGRTIRAPRLAAVAWKSRPA